MRRILLSLAITGCPLSLAAEVTLPNILTPYEAHTQGVFQLLEQGQLPQALDALQKLSAQYPNYTLPKLLVADLHRQLAGESIKPDPKLAYLYEELQYRWQHSNADVQRAETYAQWVRLPKTMDEWVLIDLEAHRLYVMQKDAWNSWRVVKDHYVSIGKAGAGKWLEGDNRTPTGVYRITGERTDESLPDIYGSGALTLDYPNAWDKMHGRTGHGIWLHGVSHADFTREPKATEGCVAMTNAEMQDLMSRQWKKGTLVVTLPHLKHMNLDALEEKLTAFDQARLTGLAEDAMLVPFEDDSRTLVYVQKSARQEDFYTLDSNAQAWAAVTPDMIPKPNLVEITKDWLIKQLTSVD